MSSQIDPSQVARVAVHPGVGIARVGNSAEYFVGPEVPWPVPPPEGGYRDREGGIKRQAARFRIYAYDASDNVLGELRADQAEIEWTVEVANKKAAWYDFEGALDTPAARPMPARNAAYVGADRARLAITPEPATVSGSHAESGPLEGRFLDLPVSLGHLKTDAEGRLLFVPGAGRSGSPQPGARPYTFGNNDGFFDDIADGPVDARVRLADGRELEAESAWVVSAPPNYAPDLIDFTNMNDVLVSSWIGGWLAQKEKPSFTDDIWPIFERLSITQWVNQGFFAQYGHGAPYEFARFVGRLASSNDNWLELRRQIFNYFRYPQLLNPNITLTAPSRSSLDADGANVQEWPWFYGDDVGTTSDWAYMSITELQYQYLYQWSEGDFEADWEGVPQRPSCLDDLDLADRPGTVDAANMVWCLGGAFHPGCEMTWPMRSTTMWSDPYRIRRRPANEPEQDYGPVLLPEQVWTKAQGPVSSGPLYFNSPGDISRWMAVPWQTDTSSCRSGYDPDYDPFLPTFWPARVPNQVLPEANYQVIMDPNSSRREKVDAFQSRATWYRFLGPDSDYFGQIETMIHRFGDLGLVEKRPGPRDTPGIPEQLYVETGVQFGDDPPADQGRIMEHREKVLRGRRRED